MENKEIKVTQMFLKLKGVETGSKAKGHEEELEVIDIDHEIGFPTSLGDLPGESREAVNYDYELIHENCRLTCLSSPEVGNLINQLWSGQVVETAILSFLESGKTYFQMEFKSVRFREVELVKYPKESEMAKKFGRDEKLVQLEFGYEKMKYIYTSVNRDGGPQGTAIAKFNYD